MAATVEMADEGGVVATQTRGSINVSGNPETADVVAMRGRAELVELVETGRRDRIFL
jgi:hypothetical protein